MALNFASNNSLSAITSLPASISGGAMTLISEQTASSSSTISFTSGIDDTYDSYVFKFYNIHPSSDNVGFKFNMSVDGGSNYNVTKTSTIVATYHYENDSSTVVAYGGAVDLAQSTSDQQISGGTGSDNDQNANGSLTIFNPSSTTFVKHFLGCVQTSGGDDRSLKYYSGGYGNTTSPVNAIIFKFSSGNIDSGVIKLYGIS